MLIMLVANHFQYTSSLATRYNSLVFLSTLNLRVFENWYWVDMRIDLKGYNSV